MRHSVLSKSCGFSVVDCGKKVVNHNLKVSHSAMAG
jgi:hypothetical protein